MAVTNFFGNTKFGPRVENYVTTTPLDLSMPRMFGRRTPLDYGVGSTLNARLSYSALGKHSQAPPTASVLRTIVIHATGLAKETVDHCLAALLLALSYAALDALRLGFASAAFADATVNLVHVRLHNSGHSQANGSKKN